jgi:ferredoxin-NADP reductase
MAQTHPTFHPIFILTSDAPDGWDGEFRRLDAHKLKKYLPELSQTDFLMCGSRELMDAVKGLLETEGVDTKMHLRKELFS